MKQRSARIAARPAQRTRVMLFVAALGFSRRRARTKGKTERGVGYAKHNALAGRHFSSWAALDAHLS